MYLQIHLWSSETLMWFLACSLPMAFRLRFRLKLDRTISLTYFFLGEISLQGYDKSSHVVCLDIV